MNTTARPGCSDCCEPRRLMLALRVYLGGYSRNHHRGYCADIETGLMPMRRFCDCNVRSFDSELELAAAVMTQFAIAANSALTKMLG